jgi:hypothetical protein
MKSVDEKRPGESVGKPPVAGGDTKAMAKREFDAALEKFKAFKYAEASRGFMRAAQLQPASTIYRLYAKWNDVVQKPPPIPVEDRAETMRLALAQIAMDGNSSFAHYVAGAIAQEDGKRAIAIKYLEEAVRLEPGHVDALRRLRVLENNK